MPKEKIGCPECGKEFDAQLDDNGEVRLTQECPRCGFLIDYNWVRTERELAKLGLEMGIARRHMINKTMPRKRFKPMPLKVGVTPEDGVPNGTQSVEPTDEDLIFEHIPLSKRVPTGRRRVNPKKRGGMNGRKRK